MEIPPSMPALDLLLKMQITRLHMGIVIDEYGCTDGLVTIEDVIEEVIGEIGDSHILAEELGNSLLKQGAANLISEQ